MRGFAAAAVLLVLTAGAARAADAPAPAPDPAEARYSAAYQKCLDTPEGQSTAGMINCSDDETKLQDAALNTAYRATMKDLNPRQKAKLLAAQRAWIAFRQAECASMEDEDWGTLSRVIAAGCFLHMTAQRVLDLENYPPAT